MNKTISMPPEMSNWIDEYCLQENFNTSEFIRMLIREFMEEKNGRRI